MASVYVRISYLQVEIEVHDAWGHYVWGRDCKGYRDRENECITLKWTLIICKT